MAIGDAGRAGDPPVGYKSPWIQVASGADRVEQDRGTRITGVPERLNVELELRQLAAIVAFSDDAIISTSLDGTVTTWNRAAEAIFGYRPEDVIGKPVFVLAAAGREDEMPRMLDRIKNGERIEHYETSRRCKDGREVAVSLTETSSLRPAQGFEKIEVEASSRSTCSHVM